MTWTGGFGRACAWLLDKIVHGLALSRISPNVLTFIGLIINIVAAFFFGHADATNAGRMFAYAGLVIIGAGLFDMVDGRVARRTGQVTVFGAFFDSVIDRYSDVVLFFGLLVYYARVNHFRYVVLTAFVMVTSLMVSYTRARAEALIGSCKVGFMERPDVPSLLRQANGLGCKLQLDDVTYYVGHETLVRQSSAGSVLSPETSAAVIGSWGGWSIADASSARQ